VDTETGEIIPHSEFEPETEAEAEETEFIAISPEQKHTIWARAKAMGINGELFKAYLTAQGIYEGDSWNEAAIPVEWYEIIMEELASGKALELAKGGGGK
jgi:hypothetical protein